MRQSACPLHGAIVSSRALQLSCSVEKHFFSLSHRIPKTQIDIRIRSNITEGNNYNVHESVGVCQIVHQTDLEIANLVNSMRIDILL